jgi:hypothetical protein
MRVIFQTATDACSDIFHDHITPFVTMGYTILNNSVTLVFFLQHLEITPEISDAAIVQLK